jgi:serine/threonine protein kinase
LLDDDNNPLKIKIIFPLALADLNTLRKQGKIFSETDIELMLKQILDGLYFLKNYVGIIHRDIKPSNILFMEDATYCITDFGISKVINKSANRNSVSVSKVFTKTVDSGTEDYLAPEILLLW